MHTPRNTHRSLRVFLSMLLLITLALTSTASADMGPKPKVFVHVNGLPTDKLVYVTLLSDFHSNGPWSASRYDVENEAFLKERPPETKDEHGYAADQVFRTYTENHPGYFYQYNREILHGNGTYAWTYYPPSNFELLLYFPEEGRFLKSNAMKRYAFESTYTVNVAPYIDELASTAEETTLLQAKDVQSPLVTERDLRSATSLLLRLALTLVIEILLALVLGFRSKRELRLIVIVNLITQGVLNVILFVVDRQFGAFAFLLGLFVLEIVIAIVEARQYEKRMDSEKKRLVSPFFYGILANAASFLIGVWLPF